jgi:hypothetical protein
MAAKGSNRDAVDHEATLMAGYAPVHPVSVYPYSRTVYCDRTGIGALKIGIAQPQKYSPMTGT